jgi:hypothetical protein
MTNRTCSLDGCDAPALARGFCNTHYARWRRNGDPGPAALLREKQGSCSVLECGRLAHSHSLCGVHYQRFRKYGTTELPTPPTLEQRLLKRVVRSEGGCWMWTGAKNLQGYGKISVQNHPEQAHRVSYEHYVGPIPDGMQIDHICHTRACINPDHLRPVTPKQNNEHRAGPSAVSSSGVLGVNWDKDRKKWAAYVTHHGKTQSVGRFDDLADAEAAVIARRLELFTHNDLDRVG